MTNINTIIEEEKKKFDEKFPSVESYSQRSGDYTEAPLPQLKYFLTTAMQRAYEAGRADWLRSEIEKLKGMKRKPLVLVTNEYKPHQSSTNGYNQALDSIITRYKEELLELDRQ